ncbi:hypothetical protein GUITHDRAFT_50416, partial [Guillardia theta CCMP2712]
VESVSLDLYENQTFALLGPNGAGKSTLLNMLTGIVSPSGGMISIFDHVLEDMNSIEKLREILGYCPQEDILLDDLTVKEHLKFFAGLRGLRGALLRKEVARRCEEMDLGSVMQEAVKNLSGGMKRRLSVALALTGDPKFVVLDEPSAGMDAKSRHALWRALAHNKKDRVLIVSTHSMDEADAIADRIGIMVHGVLKACGEPLELKVKYGLGYKLHCVFNDCSE